MSRGSVIIPSVILVAGARALAMSASFWAGILRCSGTSPPTAFREAHQVQVG